MKFANNIKLSTWRALCRMNKNAIRKIREKNFHEFNFCDVSFRGADFRSAVFRDADFRSVDFSNTDFSNSVFREADFCNADFSDADFSNTDFSNTVFQDTDFHYAVFRSAGFSDADFSDANFRYLIGDGEKIITLQLKWPVVIVRELNVIAIGCEQHSVEKWESFTDGKIALMATHALEFWDRYKNTIMDLAKG